MKRLIIATLFVPALFFASAAFAQTGMARGKVFDDQGQPLAGAKVTWEFQGGVTRKGERAELLLLALASLSGVDWKNRG